MKFMLALEGAVNTAFKEKFESLKSHVPDSRDFLFLYFGEMVSLISILKDQRLFNLNISEQNNSITVYLDTRDTKIIEFVFNLKMQSMHIGTLLLNFENELKSADESLSNFITKHKLGGFDQVAFYEHISNKEYESALKVIEDQYESLKKSLYVLFTERYNLLVLHNFI